MLSRWIFSYSVLWCFFSTTSTVLAAIECNAPIQLSADYLQSQKSAPFSNFVPSAYFAGSAVKYISAEVQEIFDDELCVDGQSTPTTIELFDDGSNGDDIAGDGIFSRSCIHFCESMVDVSDLFGFAFERDMFGIGRLVVLASNLQGQIPSVTLPTPLHPDARMVATSHVSFFVDERRTFFPEWPASLGTTVDAPTGRNAVIGAFLSVFGDVFDYLTVSAYESQTAMDGWGIYKYQRWETGGPQPNARIGETEDCIIGLNGVQTTRLLGVTTAREVVSDLTGLMHELIHGTAGYEFHNNLEAARTGDGAHVPGACTVDHSPLQATVWDWEKGFPVGLPQSYCLDNPDEECFQIAGDTIRLEANDDCASCPDAQLATCCSFRYEEALTTRSEMVAKPSLFAMSPLMLYISGFITFEEMMARPSVETTYYCMGSDTDGGCGNNDPEMEPCTISVDDSDRTRVTSEFVSRFTFQELVAANGGPRNPPRRAEPDIRHGVIMIGQREPVEAELTLYTMLFRHQEVEQTPWQRNEDRGRKTPVYTWPYISQGYSALHSRLHGIDCGGGLQVPSCTGNGGLSCSEISCGSNADCAEFDGRPLCFCRSGFVGDGSLCVDVSETVSYPQPNPFDLFATEADFCFGENDWPTFVTEDDLPTYPGGVFPHRFEACNPMCSPGEACRDGACVVIDDDVPDDSPDDSPDEDDCEPFECILIFIASCLGA